MFTSFMFAAVNPLAFWLGGTGLVILILVGLLVGIIVATGKKKIDSRQKRIAEITSILDQKLGLSGLKDPGYELAAGNLFAGLAGLKTFADKWLTPQAIDDLISHIICTSLKPTFTNFPEHRINLAKAIAELLPTLLDDKDTERILEDVIIQRLSPFKLDEETRARLVMVTNQLKDWGMDRPADAIFAAMIHDANTAKAIVQAIVTDWSTEDGRRASAKRVLRKLIPHFADNPEDVTYVRSLLPVIEPTQTGT